MASPRAFYGSASFAATFPGLHRQTWHLFHRWVQEALSHPQSRAIMSCSLRLARSGCRALGTGQCRPVVHGMGSTEKTVNGRSPYLGRGEHLQDAGLSVVGTSPLSEPSSRLLYRPPSLLRSPSPQCRPSFDAGTDCESSMISRSGLMSPITWVSQDLPAL